MSEKKEQTKQRMSQTEAAAVLRNLAQSIESGNLVLAGSAYAIPEQLFIEQSSKAKIDKFTIKVKITSADEKSEISTAESLQDLPIDSSRGSYKQLKKEMKKQFKYIVSTLEFGNLPDKEIVRKFCLCSGRMAEYDKNPVDDSYASFCAKCEELVSAIEMGSVADALAISIELDCQKRECHHK